MLTIAKIAQSRHDSELYSRSSACIAVFPSAIQKPLIEYQRSQSSTVYPRIPQACFRTSPVNENHGRGPDMRLSPIDVAFRPRRLERFLKLKPGQLWQLA